MNFLLGAYRFAALLLMSLFRRGGPFFFPDANTPNAAVWFHAASAGELESLWELIRLAVREKHAVIVTVFSRSGLPRLERLKKEMQTEFGVTISGGLSPHEGRWGPALSAAAPRAFVTAKYEAWPDLWASASRLKTPIVLVGSRDRRALRIAKAALRWFGRPLPQLLFTAADTSDAKSLQDVFPEAVVSVISDPRWDRVRERLQTSNPRAKAWAAQHGARPRPWGVLGSVWPEDVSRLASALPAGGTLFLFPHETTERMKSELLEAFMQARAEGALGASVIAMEPGFLAEFYAEADWAYVGGGFGKGVHSVLEPAVSGLPIACGPARTEKFPEVALCRSAGLLQVVDSAREFEMWGKGLDLSHSARLSRVERVKTWMGGTPETWKAIQSVLR